jgi:hypothetical protein
MHCSENLGIYRNSSGFRVNDKAQSLMSDKTSCCACSRVYLRAVGAERTSQTGNRYVSLLDGVRPWTKITSQRKLIWQAALWGRHHKRFYRNQVSAFEDQWSLFNISSPGRPSESVEPLVRSVASSSSGPLQVVKVITVSSFLTQPSGAGLTTGSCGASFETFPLRVCSR